MYKAGRVLEKYKRPMTVVLQLYTSRLVIKQSYNSCITASQIGLGVFRLYYNVNAYFKFGFKRT